MKYGITTLVASPSIVEIDEAQYKAIKYAMANLFEMLYLEENLDLVTENFQEYEVELLSIASRNTVFDNFDYFSMGRERNVVCRRIVNLLSACRMYLDQSIHHITNIYGENSDIVNLIKKEIASQYDQNFGYRVMEALRNYTQHRGFPVHSISFPGKWLNIDDSRNSRLRHTVIPSINVSKLAEDGNFKQSILGEMNTVAIKDKIDLRPLIRSYVESIGKTHEKARELSCKDVEKWEELIEDAIKLFQGAFGPDASRASLYLVAEKDNRWIERRSIFKEFIEKRRILESKNRVFVNLHKRYASNEIEQKDG